MKKLLLSLFVIIAIVLTLLFLARDPIAKFAIEIQGSETWGAPVRISDIEINVINNTVHIKNLNLANPDSPQSTLAKADDLHIKINPKLLFDKKIDIGHLEISGLSLLKHLAIDHGLSKQRNPEIALPNLTFANTDTLIASKKLALKTDIDQIKIEVRTIENKWKNTLDQLKNRDRLDEYKVRIDRLKGKGDLFEKLAAAKDLETIYREIRQDVEQIKSLEDDFKQDREHLKKQITAARDLPQKYSKELIQSFGFDADQLSHFASNAFAGSLKETLQDLLSGIAISNGSDTKTADPSYDIVIHKAVIKGPIFEQIQGLAITANLSDLTYPLKKANNPISVNLAGGIGSRNDIQVISTIDHRNGIDDNFKINISGLRLQNIPLARHPDMSIGLDRAVLSMTGELSLKGEEIAGELVQSFSDSKFSTLLTADAPKAARVIAELLAAASEFGLNLNFSGTLSDPKLSFKTSKLDKLIGDAVANELHKQVQRLQSDTSHSFNQQLDPDIQLLLSQLEGLNSMGLELENQKRSWRNLGK